MDNLLDNAPCGFISFLDDGGMIVANKTLGNLLGHSESLSGKNVESILTIPSRIFYNTHFFPLLKLQLKAEEIFLMLVTRDKISVPVIANASRQLVEGVFQNHCVFVPVYQRQKYEDEILRAKKIAEDALNDNKALITIKEKLEDQALELDQQLSKLISINQNTTQFNKILAHDFNEPLRKIKLFTDFVNKDPNSHLSDRAKSATQKVLIASDRIQRLTQALQEFVNLDFEFDHKRVALDEAFERAVKRVIMKNEFEEFTVVNDGLPVIAGDPVQLELLFYHLVDNSVKFRNPEMTLIVRVGSVTLQENVFRSTSDKYKYVDFTRITFSDNGPGFPEEYKTYVFDLFKKIDGATHGVGLGLPLCKKIIENHSGSISVSSSSREGTEFRILLPVERS